ncbi:MAG: hypothetical protein K9K37_09210 [Desulfocapsa sp.]|nr:hypothetical protein [Desulfocapsa sp.]
MSKTQVIIALVVLCLVGVIWGSIQDKKSTSLERQLAAMKQQASSSATVVDASAVKAAQAEVKALKSQNKELLADIANLRGSLVSQQKELVNLKKEMTAAAGGSEVLKAMQVQLDESSAKRAKLEEKLVAAMKELAEKNTALAAAEEAAAGLEDVKSTLANTVDAYSAKSQELAAEVESSVQRIHALENDLEEQTKLLAVNEEELGRTKLNMNVLLSKIAAQNKSLAILEETRIALEKELATKFQVIEDLQRQLSAQVGVEAVVEEESHAEEATPAKEAQVQ